MKRRPIAEGRGICLESGPFRSTISHYTIAYKEHIHIDSFSCNYPRSLRNVWTCPKRYDGLRYPPIVRIVTQGIAKGLTLHDFVPTSTSWGAIAGRRKLKIVQCEACLMLVWHLHDFWPRFCRGKSCHFWDTNWEATALFTTSPCIVHEELKTSTRMCANQCPHWH